MNKDIMMATSKNQRFSKFVPRSTDPDNNTGLNYADDFTFNPTKFYCKKHSSNEVEFWCEINNTFYCKKCQSDHMDHRGD
jgi:hypothetical protein